MVRQYKVFNEMHIDCDPVSQDVYKDVRISCTARLCYTESVFPRVLKVVLFIEPDPLVFI